MKKFLVLVMLLGFCSTSLISPAQASHDLFNHVGSLVSMPLGAGVGAIRGTLSGSLGNVHTLSDEFHPLLSIVTIPVGMAFGAGLGGVSGLIKGASDGYNIGYDKPFTLESISLTGDLLDYDYYSVNL